MEAMDPRHLEVYDLIRPTLGEEPARKLVIMGSWTVLIGSAFAWVLFFFADPQ